MPIMRGCKGSFKRTKRKNSGLWLLRRKWRGTWRLIRRMMPKPTELCHQADFAGRINGDSNNTRST